MRVLFGIIPEKTIFLTMAPLAWAMRNAGHEVLVASQPRFAGVITQAGLTAAPVGRDIDLWRLARLDPELLEQARVGLPEPWNVVADPSVATWEDMLLGHVDAVNEGHRLDNFPIIAGLVELARQWLPDLVIWEPLSYAGAIAAKACGAAHARVLWSIDVFGITREIFVRLAAAQPPEQRADPLAEWLGSYGRKYGFDYTEDMTSGQLTIDQLPASLGARAGNLDYLPLRYVAYGGPAPIPRWLWEPPARPRVALTLGTTATESFAGYSVDVPAILDAVADLEVELVATIAPTEQRKLVRVPDNVRLETYVPLHALAPTCAVVINHAGPGTLLTTAWHAVPQLTVPWEFDAPELARRAAAQGATLTVSADRATGQAVREAVLRLLHEPTFRERAAALRDEIHAMPAADQLVPRLEALAAGHGTDT